MEYIEKDAVLSSCEKYRYMLKRVWNKENPVCLFIGLNPSTADATEDDPTIRRCVTFADSWGCGTLLMGNLFAFRATKPKDMIKASDPVGMLNNGWLREMGANCKIVVAAWGANGAINARDHEVRRLITKQMYHFGLTKAGQPRHPLYLKADTQLIRY